MSASVEYLNSLGLSLKQTSKRNNGEYSGPCPFCKEGVDRFGVTPSPSNSPFGLYYCRQCKKGGKIQDLVGYLNGNASRLPKNEFYSGFSSKEQGRTDKTNSKKAPPSKEWQKTLKAKVSQFFDNIAVEEVFSRRGINGTTVKELRLGYNSIDKPIKCQGETVTFSEGMILTVYRGDDLYSVQFRKWLNGSGYYYFKGSVPVPYHYTKLQKIEAPVIIVESALDAIVLYQEAGDLVHAVALGSAQAKPDAYLKALLSKATAIFVCMDYDDTGFEAAGWWQENYPVAKICYCPKGKDVGDYHLGGGSVRQWVNELVAGKIPTRPEPEVNFQIISKSEQAEKLLSAIKDNEMTPGISISENFLGIALTGQAYAIDLQKVQPESLALLSDITVITYDGVDFIEKLSKSGLKCGHLESTRLQLLTISGMLRDQETLAQYRIGYSSAFYKGEHIQTALQAHINWKIHEIQIEILHERGLVKAYQLYTGAQQAVAEIRMTGICFDKEFHKYLYDLWQSNIKMVDVESAEFDRLQYRISTYGENYADKSYDPETSRIHADFKYTESPTARFSCSEPNLMGVPKDELRKAYRASEGKVLVGADFSQIDLRTAAMITGDKKMIHAFQDGFDFHTITAAKIYNLGINDVSKPQRNKAKAVNYSVIYGSDSDQAKALRREMSSIFPHFYDWLTMQMESFRTVFHVETPAGRTILWKDICPKWRRQLCNFPIQAGSSEVMLAALANIHSALVGLEAKIILCVHDEVILEVTEQEAEAAGEALESAMIQGFLDIFPGGPVKGLVNLKQGNTWADIT